MSLNEAPILATFLPRLEVLVFRGKESEKGGNWRDRAPYTVVLDLLRGKVTLGLLCAHNKGSPSLKGYLEIICIICVLMHESKDLDDYCVLLFGLNQFIIVFMLYSSCNT